MTFHGHDLDKLSGLVIGFMPILFPFPNLPQNIFLSTRLKSTPGLFVIKHSVPLKYSLFSNKIPDSIY